MEVKVLMGFLAAFFSAIAAHLFGRKVEAKPLQPGNSPVSPVPPVQSADLPAAPKTTAYAPETWRPFVVMLAGNIPVAFLMNYITIESGGNPCATGMPGNGPDGFPKEQGIGQLYNPDDMTSLKIPAGSLRKYCRTGTQVCIRPLTQTEMATQVKALVAKINHDVRIANRILIANGANTQPGWSTRGEDFWRLVKLVHGLPGLANGMAFVTKKLGHAPTNWKEFKDQVMAGVKMDSGTEHFRFKYANIFDNAERTADGAGAATV